MGEDHVDGRIFEFYRGHIYAALGKYIELSCRLGERGLAAPVGTRKKIDHVVFIENKIIGNDLVRIPDGIYELEIVEPFSLHIRAVVTSHDRRLAEYHSGFSLLFDILGESDVVDKFGYEL